MLKRGGQGRHTANQNKVRERAMWIYGRGIFHTQGASGVKALRISMPNDCHELHQAIVTGSEQIRGRVWGIKSKT